MTNPIVRQIKIDLITDTHNPIIKWFNNLWDQLSIVETNVYHEDGGEFIYYVGGTKKYIFFQDNNSGRFWCNYDHYWSIIKIKFDLKYQDIQEITQLLVENALNTNISSAVHHNCTVTMVVEKALNSPPDSDLLTQIDEVENALNNIL